MTTNDKSVQSKFTSEIIVNDLIQLPRLEQITTTSSEDKVLEQELLQINTELFAIHQALPHIRSVDSLCKLANATAKLITLRRGCMKMQMGSKENSPNQGRVLEVL